MTPGTNEKRYLAGALDLTTGILTHCVWYTTWKVSRETSPHWE
jgi:hypothetical protein